MARPVPETELMCVDITVSTLLSSSIKCFMAIVFRNDTEIRIEDELDREESMPRTDRMFCAQD